MFEQNKISTPYFEVHIRCAQDAEQGNFQSDSSTPPWLSVLRQKLHENPEVQLTQEDVQRALEQG